MDIKDFKYKAISDNYREYSGVTAVGMVASDIVDGYLKSDHHPLGYCNRFWSYCFDPIYFERTGGAYIFAFDVDVVTHGITVAACKDKTKKTFSMVCSAGGNMIDKEERGEIDPGYESIIRGILNNLISELRYLINNMDINGYNFVITKEDF